MGSILPVPGGANPEEIILGPKPDNIPQSPESVNLKVSSSALPALSSNSNQNNSSDWRLNFSLKSFLNREQYKNLSDIAVNLDEKDLPEFYQFVEEAFRKIEHSDGILSWIHRGDLLDAIDCLVSRDPARFKHLNITQNQTPNEFKESSVPLIDYKTVKVVNEVLGGNTIATLEDLKGKVDVLPENSKAAAVIDKVTRQNAGIVAWFFRLVERVVTSIAGWKFNSPALFGNQLDKIADASIGMNIKSSEVLAVKKENETTKEYRGPKFLFGKSLHQFATVNDWFKRSLTEEATKLYVAKAEQKESSLTLKYGVEEQNVSRVVISNSDSRLRFHDIEPGKFGDTYELTGKVLNPESEELAKKRKDNPIYYEDKYKFSPKNLLGRLESDSMEPRSVKDQKGDKQIIAAQHELLSGMYRAFDRRGATQVIQRLAPEDVHNYVAPLNGKPLSNLEATKFLAEQTGVNEQEKQHFKDLEEVFIKQEQELKRPSQPTIDIYGSLASVSTKAVSNRSSILSQNDRKIMLYKHEDGSFSMHVFIGATGVGKVDVSTETNPLQRGARQGDMQFGLDIYQKEDSSTVRDTKTRDGLNKLTLGRWQGGFPINGSTVISYYLPKDFTLYPKLEEAKEKLAYGEGIERAEVELKAQMGSPILVKTEFAMAELLEKKFPKEFSELAKMDIKDQKKGVEKLISELQTISSKLSKYIQDDSNDSKDLKTRLEALLYSRLKVIKGYQSLLNRLDIKKGSFDPEQIEAFAQAAVKGIMSMVKEMPLDEKNEIFNDIKLLLNKDALNLEERMVVRKFEKQITGYINSVLINLN
jgi:phosphatidylserine decarboxylase